MDAQPSSPTLVWFRNDLRVADHPALVAAVARGRPIIPIFIWSPEDDHPFQPGAASRWWLHFSLLSLDAELRQRGSRLTIRTGNTKKVLEQLIADTGATTVLWHRRYEPATIQCDTSIKAWLKANSVQAESFNGSLLHEPWEIQSKSGGPYKVFTPFSQACRSTGDPPVPLAAPHRIPGPDVWPSSVPVDQLKLLPKIRWDAGFYKYWKPGCQHAAAGLNQFLDRGLNEYSTERDRPDHSGTSRISPALHFGELSPRQVWQAATTRGQSVSRNVKGDEEPYLRQLLWRDFAHHLLFHFPQTTTGPLRREFDRFAWRDDPDGLAAWQRGQTGYPIVDAGMRELWTTGWMHNRVRMIAASFLVKDLLIPWQSGAAWFWDTLVDADLANNTLGWQWTAGCGADAAPYFRIFNPVSQGEKFDPDGVYVRRWVPELSTLPDKWIHQPWSAPGSVLHDARIKLGSTYPLPIVDHNSARLRALDAFGQLRHA